MEPSPVVDREALLSLLIKMIKAGVVEEVRDPDTNELKYRLTEAGDAMQTAARTRLGRKQ